MLRLYRYGFAAHLALVVLVSAGAYAGVLPTSLAGLPGADKVGHFFLIGALGALLDGALARRASRIGPLRAPLGPTVVLIAAGVEEYLQRLSPRRDSSLADYLADVAGVIALTWCSRALERSRVELEV